MWLSEGQFCQFSQSLPHPPPRIPSRVYCRSAPTVASDLILKELGGQYLLFYSPFTFTLNLNQSLGGILWPVCRMGLGMLVLRSNKDSQVTPFNVLLLN